MPVIEEMRRISEMRAYYPLEILLNFKNYFTLNMSDLSKRFMKMISLHSKNITKTDWFILCVCAKLLS